MAEGLERRTDAARVAGQRDEGVVVRGKDVVEQRLEAGDLVAARLARVRVPEGVVFRKAGLERPRRVLGVDPRLGAAAVARVQAEAFAEQLLDDRGEGAGFGERQVAEGVVGRREAACQWRDVVRLWSGDASRSERVGPEAVGDESLLDARWCQMGVGPGDGAVAIQQRPVAVPCGRSVVALSYVVKALSMPSHDEHFVLLIGRGIGIEAGHIVCEALPLRLFTRGIK